MANATRQACDEGIGTWTSLTSVTLILGPLPGGYSAENIPWRAAFFINVPLAVMNLAITRSRVPESRDPDARRPDFPGELLATAGLGGVVVEVGLGRCASARSPDRRCRSAGGFPGFGGTRPRTDDAALTLPFEELHAAPLLRLVRNPLLSFRPDLGARILGDGGRRHHRAYVPLDVGSLPLLVLGPAITALSFALFVVAGVGRGSYWTGQRRTLARRQETGGGPLIPQGAPARRNIAWKEVAQ
jgi:hypothetical protein